MGKKMKTQEGFFTIFEDKNENGFIQEVRDLQEGLIADRQ